VAARDELFTRVYPELRSIARRQLGGRRQATLQATDLLHETYLRVSGQQQLSWQNRVQFFAFASQVARQVLVDRYRRKDSLKRGKGFQQLTLDAERLTAPEAPVDVLVLDDALTRLAGFDAEAARVVELRYFGGLTLPEIAACLAMGEATAQRRWSMARAWLRRQLSPGEP
jgi:RNA polymerase sigma factor (TIGR02999 family)